MIGRFGSDAALLVIDAQRGVNDVTFYGGPDGRRNNPDAEHRIRDLLGAWRRAGLPVFFSLHDSREERSPLKLSLPTGASIEDIDPQPGDGVVTKDVNSAFIGTDLEIKLRRAGIRRLVNCGFFTNMCVETTTRQAGNLGFDTYLVHDACAATNRIDLAGVDHEPSDVHGMAVANLHGEFCTALTTADVLTLLAGDRPDLQRSQGNE